MKTIIRKRTYDNIDIIVVDDYKDDVDGVLVSAFGDTYKIDDYFIADVICSRKYHTRTIIVEDVYFLDVVGWYTSAAKRDANTTDKQQNELISAIGKLTDIGVNKTL